MLERRREVSPLPRATGISTRSMELFRSWGLEERIRSGAADVEWLGWSSERLLDATGSPFPVGFPTRQQAALISPTSPACVSQDQLEPVLLEHLRSLRLSRLERGVALESLTLSDDGAQARVRDLATRQPATFHARYLIGPDGLHSTVRHMLDIGVHGKERLTDRVGVQFSAPPWPLLAERRYAIYPITSSDAASTFIPAGGGDRWIYARSWDPARERLDHYSRERLLAMIRREAGSAAITPRIERITAVTYGTQLGESFRAGAAFLIGDAAHRVTPRGATGLNMAIQDGYDIAWKLAWVLHGWARADLLNSYEDERRPVAEHNLARSADPAGSIRDPGEALRSDVGPRIAHAWLPSNGQGTSTLDLLGPGLTLFTSAAGAPVGVPARPSQARPSRTVRRLDPMTARALGIQPGGTLLVRPDGAPVAREPQPLAEHGPLGARTPLTPTL